jgi:uncharacterized protein YndB with AHSA1/START domain
MKDEPVIVENLLHAPATAVWKAFTDKDEIKKWYFSMEAFEPVIGFKFSFTGGPPGGILYTHLCRILEIIPGKKLVHTWAYAGYRGESELTIELEDRGNDTFIRLKHAGLESFPKENKDFAKENFIAGWNEIINNSLPAYLDKQQLKF